MSDVPYDQLEMARDRTILANERTFLAYGRTALGLIGAAIVIFKFASREDAIIFGPLCLVVAVAIFIWGMYNYRAFDAKIKGTQRPASELAAEPVLAEADL